MVLALLLSQVNCKGSTEPGGTFPARLVFSVQPSNVVAGNTFSVEVTALDAQGNRATGANPAVTLGLGTDPGGGTLSGVSNPTYTNSVATFSGLSIDKAGTGYTLTAAGWGVTGATSAPFNVTAGPAAKLAFTVQPTDVGAGAPISPAVQVTVEDNQGNALTTSGISVTVTIQNNYTGAILSGTTTVTTVNGVATFSNLSIDKLRTGYGLGAAASGLTGANSSAFNVTAGAATKLAFSVQPTTATAATALSPALQVTVQDAGGNTVTSATTSITLAIGTNPASGTLSGTATVAAVGGVATFSTLSIDKAGTGYTLTAAAIGLTGATSSAFNVTAGAATALAFTVQPSNATAGAAISPAVAVTVQDAHGNTVTSSSASVTLAIGTNPASGTLSGTLANTSFGVATFYNLSIDKAGTGYTLTAAATGLTGTTSAAFNVTVGSASKLAFTAQPTNATAATAISPAVQVTVQDAQGNTVASATTSITMAIGTNPASGTLSGTTTVAAVNGVASFSNLTIDKVGSGYTLRATATSLTSATSSAFNVTAGAAAKLAFSVQPTTATAATALSPAPQVTVQDAGGNTVTSATTSITLAIGTNPASGTLSGTATVAAVSGVATFSNLSIDKAGTGYTLTAAATGLTGATSNTFNISPGAATALAFTAQPSNVTAGAAISPAVAVTVQDAQGNTVTSSSAMVTLAIGTNPASGILSGTMTVFAVSGVATFSNLKINSAGSGYTLTASVSGLTGATSGAFNVTFGAAAKLIFTVQPTSAAAGTVISPAVAVTVQDSQGNTVTSAATSITLAIASNPASGTLSGTTTIAAVSGVATFSDLSIDKVGSGYTLTATATGLTSATSGSFNVTIGAAAKLAFTGQPSTVNAGASISPAVQVKIQDAQGNTVTSATNSVTLAIGTNPGGGALSGTATVAAASGVATFYNVSISNAGIGYTLTATATGLTSATSAAFNVVGPASKLAFSVQPSGAVAHATIAPAVTVTVQDALGQTVTSASNSITLAIGTNPASGTLSGTTTGSAVKGVATFSTLSINNAGTGYTLTASSTGLAGATSATFDIAAFGAAAKLAFAVQPTNDTINGTITPAVQVAIQDAQGNTVTSSSATITVALGTNPGSATLGGTLGVAAVSGVATFSNLAVNAPGSGYTLAASSSGLTGATSATFNVLNPNAAIKLGFVQQPTSTTAGSTIVPAVTVAIQTAAGATVTTDNSTVISLTIASGPAGGTLRGTLSATAVNGVATFSTLSDTVSGAYTLSATASGLTSATSASYTISAGAATRIAFLQQPTDTRAGELFAPVVRVAVTDVYGNTVPSATNSVTMASLCDNWYYAGYFGCWDVTSALKTSIGSAAISGTLTVAAVNGVASFPDLRQRLEEEANGKGMALQASATAMGGTWSATFYVTPSSPTQVWVGDVPTNIVANTSFRPSAYVLDSLDNLVNAGSNVISLAIGSNPSAGTLTLANNLTAVNGQAQFTVSIDKGGNGYTLVASTSGLTSLPSFAFNVLPFGTASRLAFTVQPSNAAVGATIAPAVQVCVQDGVGNVVTTATNSITVAIGTNPGAATLGGTLNVAATYGTGCATFSNLTLSTAGTAYTLTASASSLTGATSSAFNIQ